MIDDVIDQVLEKTIAYCGKEDTQQKFVKPLEQFIAVRFSWIIRCFEVIAALAILHTVLLVLILARVWRRFTP